MLNVFIVGARGYKYPYGGWETFVTNLVKNSSKENVFYYIPNLTHDKKEDGKILTEKKVFCPYLYVPKQGFMTMFTFTIKAIQYVLKYLKKEPKENVILIILGCKVGPLMPFWKRKLKKLGVKTIINPDGLEWTRDKWAWWIKKCFKISERYSIKYADYCVCDSKAILKYIQEKYQKYHKPSMFISYGAYENMKPGKTKIITELFKKYQLKENNYYLIVGRFIPENNYETMIKEFMKTKTTRDLVIVCNLEENKFYQELLEKTKFKNDKRIKFVGSLYDEESLLYLRQHAFAYLHGHSAGGTNPSLLEALANTNVNILFDVSYNKEVGLDSCFYFSKKENNLKRVIMQVEKLTPSERKRYGKLARERIHKEYTWNVVVDKYMNLFQKLI